ncbi:MAG: helix-turn-helix domain-containing protein [Thermomicrobiales bacterium]|nr:helix-turn-helix domain-containing protein [Thermomicrobiales bacterium]
MAGSSRLTVADAARILDRSTEQVRRYLREGVLPGERIGNQWFISQADLDHMLETRQRGASLAELILAADRDPLGAVIGIGGSGGSEIALGATAYLQALVTAEQS